MPPRANVDADRINALAQQFFDQVPRGDGGKGNVLEACIALEMCRRSLVKAVPESDLPLFLAVLAQEIATIIDHPTEHDN